MVQEDNKAELHLDEIVKLLFEVSDKVLIQMLNSLFNENNNIEETEITFEKKDFISKDLHTIYGDLFLKLEPKGKKPNHYHIEIQTLNDSTMVIRMFEYGFQKAKELSKYEKSSKKEELILYMPRQLAMFIEQNKNIKDELRARIIFPDEKEIEYIVPVMKYWEYDDKELTEQKLYPLLPLQIFKHRYEMEKLLEKTERGSEELIEKIHEVKATTKRIAHKGAELFEKAEVNGEDLEKILVTVINLFEYLNSRYTNNDKGLNEEVEKMTKSLYDPAVEAIGIEKGEEKKAIEVAKEMLADGEPMAKIIKYSKLTEEEILELKAKLN